MTSQRHRLAAPPEALDDDPPIGSVMTPHVVAIAPDAPLRVGLRLMASNNLRHLPVIENSRCLGVVLETDIVRAVALGEPQLLGPLVRAYRPCRSTSGDRRPPALCWQGTSTQFSSVMGARPVGVVTTTDLARSLAAGARAEQGDSQRPCPPD
jgi:acetoin utilization protein AcuB